MIVIALSAEQQAQVKILQDQFKQSQAQHIASYRKLLSHLQNIAGVQPDGKKIHLAVDETGQNIIVGRN